MTIMSNNPIEPDEAPSKAANWLGYAGLIPFFAASIGTIVFRSDIELQSFIGLALLVYGAVILSFLGGIRWGMALHLRERQGQMWQFCLSVLPSLLGWVCVLLPSLPVALLVLAFGFLAQLYFDLRSAVSEQLPKWFAKLRVHLTAGAVISLVLGAGVQLL